MGGPGRVHLGPLLAVGLGCVDGPKQLQPIALCLSRDGDSPLDLVRTSEHLTLPGEASGWDPNFRERRLGEVRRIPPTVSVRLYLSYPSVGTRKGAPCSRKTGPSN